ncbi:MAG TPA: phospholipase D family protein [Chitinivibrionales bacterium]|nr:phospholipase D family protein [Chitinivibrionales bacterium]
METIQFITDRDIYSKVVLEEIPKSKRFVWIGTSDLKDLYVSKKGRMVPFLEVLSDCAKRGVEIRLIHAKEPGRAFRADFDKYPALIDGMERILCPRVHFKCVVIDGAVAYMGSANLTGAGMGAKADVRRNFEMGIMTTDKKIIKQIMEEFDGIWMGNHCASCDRKQYCADYKDLL